MALKGFRAHHRLPPVQVVEPEIWGDRFFRRNSHIKADYSTAVANVVRATGKRMSSDEEEALRLILTHACGWSATCPTHMDDNWVRYVRAFPKVPIEGLYPILDSLTWEEDLEKYSPGCYPFDPSLFLFGNSQKYYLYYLEDDAMYCAGETLVEVYEGLKVARFHGDKEGDWVDLEEHPAVEEMRAGEFFPVYWLSGNNDIITLAQPIKDFDEEYAKVMLNLTSPPK
jgi:hypothetical protein